MVVLSIVPSAGASEVALPLEKVADSQAFQKALAENRLTASLAFVTVPGWGRDTDPDPSVAGTIEPVVENRLVWLLSYHADKVAVPIGGLDSVVTITGSADSVVAYDAATGDFLFFKVV